MGLCFPRLQGRGGPDMWAASPPAVHGLLHVQASAVAYSFKNGIPFPTVYIAHTTHACFVSRTPLLFL